MLRWAGVVCALLTLLFAASCTGPKVITGATSRGDQIKLMTRQAGWSEVVIVCKADKDGTLVDCKQKKLEFRD